MICSVNSGITASGRIFGTLMLLIENRNSLALDSNSIASGVKPNGRIRRVLIPPSFALYSP